MTKVVVVVLDWNDNLTREQFESLSDEELVKNYSSGDFVFTLKQFQEAINDELLSVDDCFIRFIEVDE